MRVLLKLVLPCDPDVAWVALRNPEVLRAISAPLVSLRSLEPDGFPESWEGGPHRVELRAAGIIPMGVQVVDVTLIESGGVSDGQRDRASDGGTLGDSAPDRVRMLRDSGGAESGLLRVVRGWRHRMAVSAAPGGGTLYRDELRFSAGILSPLAWPAFWVFWQLRALRIREVFPRAGALTAPEKPHLLH